MALVYLITCVIFPKIVQLVNFPYSVAIKGAGGLKEGGLFRYGRGFIPHYAKLARMFLPRMQNVKVFFSAMLFLGKGVFSGGCFFRTPLKCFVPGQYLLIFCKYFFLAHLSRSDMVSLCDRVMSGVRRAGVRVCVRASTFFV